LKKKLEFARLKDVATFVRDLQINGGGRLQYTHERKGGMS